MGEIRELDDLNLEAVGGGKQVALPIIGGLAWWAIQRWLSSGKKPKP